MAGNYAAGKPTLLKPSPGCLHISLLFLILSLQQVRVAGLTYLVFLILSLPLKWFGGKQRLIICQEKSHSSFLTPLPQLLPTPSEHPSKGKSKAMDPSPTSTSSLQRDISTLGQAAFPAATVSRRLPFSLAPSPNVPADPAITGCPAGHFLPPSRDPDYQRQNAPDRRKQFSPHYRGYILQKLSARTQSRCTKAQALRECSNHTNGLF